MWEGYEMDSIAHILKINAIYWRDHLTYLKNSHVQIKLNEYASKYIYKQRSAMRNANWYMKKGNYIAATEIINEALEDIGELDVYDE